MRWQTTTDNDNDDYQVQQEVTIVKPDLPTLILPTYDFNSNDMQSTVILITCQSQSMAPKRPAPKGPQINAQLYTALVQRRGWVRWVKCGCPLHRHPSFTRCHIRTSAFYHCPTGNLPSAQDNISRVTVKASGWYDCHCRSRKVSRQN